MNCFRMWESHIELASDRQMGTDRQSPRAFYQVTVDGQSSVESPETESLEDIIRKLLPTPARPPLEAAPIPSDTVPVQMTTMVVGSLCPPVVAQTIPKEGCDPASPRRLRRGRDVLMKPC